MSKPFAWRDFTKKYDDLSTNNFPSVNKKSKQVQDTLKFKFSSKVQSGVVKINYIFFPIFALLAKYNQKKNYFLHL